MNMKIDLEKDVDYHVTDLRIEDIVPNAIDNIVVSIVDGQQNIFLPPTVTKDSYKFWKKNRGGVFAKDVRLHTFGKQCGSYLAIKFEDKSYIIRLISDDELYNFQIYDLVDGVIKDKPFMVLKQLIKSDEYRSSRIDIDDNYEHEHIITDKVVLTEEEIIKTMGE